MRSVLKATAVLAAAGLAVPLWAPPAFAETSEEPASVGAYFYASGLDKPAAAPFDPMNPTGTATDGVSAGNLAVAVRTPNAVDKKSFLAFDLAEVPFEATISKAVVTIPLAEVGPMDQQIAPAPEKVQACGAGPEGFNGEDGASFAVAPTDTCKALAVVGKADAEGTSYVFDVTKIAQTWLTDANNGLALLPAVTDAPFQVVFRPFAEATIAVEFTAPADELEVVVEAPIAPAPVDTGFTSTPETSFDTGSVGAPDNSFGVAEAPVVDQAPAPEVMPAAQPQVAEQTPVLAVPVASARPSEIMDPTVGAWLGAGLFAVLLALLSLIMGDSRVPAPGATRPSRLSQALSAREPATAAPAGRPRLRALGA